jgi:hypothetical protein
MAKAKKSSSKASKTRRLSKPRKVSKAPRQSSDAARTRKIARELEKAQQAQEANAVRAQQLREQMASLRERCPHTKLRRDEETGNIVCRNCLAIVGVPRVGNDD